MMKWMVVLLLFLFGCHKQIVLPTSSSTNILLSALILFSWIHCASLGLNTSFSLALIFFLLHLCSCTHLLSFLDRRYSNPCLFLLFLFFFFDLTTIEGLIARHLTIGTTVVDWDSMDCVITQTRNQAFETLGRAF